MKNNYFEQFHKNMANNDLLGAKKALEGFDGAAAAEVLMTSVCSPKVVGIPYLDNEGGER